MDDKLKTIIVYGTVYIVIPLSILMAIGLFVFKTVAFIHFVLKFW